MSKSFNQLIDNPLNQLKRCQEKTLPLYTKTFGGKIWTNLHSVSPGNFLNKKFKMASIESSRQKIILTSPRAKKFKLKREFVSYPQKKHPEKNFNFSCLNQIWNRKISFARD